MGRIQLSSNRKAKGSPLTQHIGKQILALRAKKQVSMRVIGEATGLSNAFICQMENGDSEPGAATLLALAKYFGVKVDYFFRGFDAREKP